MHQTKQIIQSIFVLIFAATLLACDPGGGVEAEASFANTSDIKEGTPIYFNDQVVGEVTDVELKGNGSELSLEFDKEAVQSISANSAVVVNRLKEGAPLEIYNQTELAGEPLQSGQQIRGFDSMFQLGAWKVGDAIQLGAEAVSEYVSAFQDYLGSEKFQQDKEIVQDQINNATEVAKEALKAVEEDLNNAAEQIKGQEKIAAETLEQLGEELVPLVEELGQGSSELVAELERFTQGLEETNADERQAGEVFLDSLLQTMERLNDSMEESAAMAEQDRIAPVEEDEAEIPAAPTDN